MFKRSIILVLTLICILSISIIIAGCSEQICEEDAHVWEDQAVTLEATCTTEGSLLQKCSVCSLERDFVIAALGHDLQIEPNSNYAPTCTTDGYTGKSFCVRQDCTYSQDGTTIPALGHAYGQWISLGDDTHKKVCATDATHVEVANCSGGTADCENKAVCSICSAQYGELGSHVFDKQIATEKYQASAATCEVLATYYYSCKCGLADVNTYEHGELVAHTESEAIQENVINASCEAAGSYDSVVYCSVCEEEISRTSETIAKLDHDMAYHVAVAANCTTAGNVEYWACSTCEKNYDAEQNGNVIDDVIIPINPEAHLWNDGEVTEVATCTKEGMTTYTCSQNSGHTKTEPIVKIDHVFENPTLVIINDVLQIKSTCYCTEESFVNVDASEPLPIATENDLRIAISAGYNIVLADDVVLTNGSIDIEKDVTLNLNGHNVSCYTNKKSPTTEYMVCDVFIVRGSTLTILGNGTLYANNDDADSVCIISALDGATVNIYGGKYVSAGSTTLYARTESVINIYDGEIIAEVDWDGTYYTLDIKESEEEAVRGKINVYGGTYFAFDPANHPNDASYTNKVADGYHSLYNEETNTYIVSAHVYDNSVSVLNETQHTLECVCGATKNENHTPYNVEGKCNVCDAQLVVISTYSYTFESKQFNENGMKTLNDVDWTIAGDGAYWGYTGTKGQQFGKADSPYTTLTLSSTSFKNVSEIIINTSGASSIKCTLDVFVGETKVAEGIALTSTATSYTIDLDLELTGEVKFVFNQTSSKAIYVKSMEITCVE